MKSAEIVQDGEGEEEGEEEGAQVGQAGWGLEKECRVIGRRLELAAFYATRRHLPPFLVSSRRVDLFLFRKIPHVPTESVYRLVWRSCARSSRSSKASLRSFFFPARNQHPSLFATSL